jgi:hypothetical protein
VESEAQISGYTPHGLVQAQMPLGRTNAVTRVSCETLNNKTPVCVETNKRTLFYRVIACSGFY